MCLNPPRGIFCWEVGKTCYTKSSASCLNPPRGIFCWEADLRDKRPERGVLSQSPTGDFLLGRRWKSKQYRTISTGLNPPRGIFCWEGGTKKSVVSPLMSQSPTGDFLLGRLDMYLRRIMPVPSQSPTGDFLLGSEGI